MIEDREHFEKVADLVPPDCIPVCAFRGVLYVDQDGEQKYNGGWTADQPMSTLIGLIELLRDDILAMRREHPA